MGLPVWRGQCALRGPEISKQILQNLGSSQPGTRISGFARPEERGPFCGATRGHQAALGAGTNDGGEARLQDAHF